jgi:hypothetical protein
VVEGSSYLLLTFPRRETSLGDFLVFVSRRDGYMHVERAHDAAHSCEQVHLTESTSKMMLQEGK